MDRIRYALIRDLIHHLDEKDTFNVGNCDAALSDRIEGLPMPMQLKRVFQWTWVNKTARSEQWKYYLYSTKAIFSVEWFERLLNAKMLEIGSAANGDNLVIRLLDEGCEVGLLDCTQLAAEGEADPNGFYVKICESLDELLFRMVESKFLPIDYWSAIELAELKSKNAKDRGSKT